MVALARKQGEPNYLFEQEELLKKTQINDEEDELFYEACEFVIAMEVPLLLRCKEGLKSAIIEQQD